jgi:hypothetical protein
MRAVCNLSAVQETVLRVKLILYITSSSTGTTTLSWVSACSTVVEHSQQEGFTECRC